jgi:hypothetical protein
MVVRQSWGRSIRHADDLCSTQLHGNIVWQTLKPVPADSSLSPGQPVQGLRANASSGPHLRDRVRPPFSRGEFCPSSCRFFSLSMLHPSGRLWRLPAVCLFHADRPVTRPGASALSIGDRARCAQVMRRLAERRGGDVSAHHNRHATLHGKL